MAASSLVMGTSGSYLIWGLLVLVSVALVVVVVVVVDTTVPLREVTDDGLALLIFGGATGAASTGAGASVVRLATDESLQSATDMTADETGVGMRDSGSVRADVAGNAERSIDTHCFFDGDGEGPAPAAAASGVWILLVLSVVSSTAFLLRVCNI